MLRSLSPWVVVAALAAVASAAPPSSTPTTSSPAGEQGSSRGTRPIAGWIVAPPTAFTPDPMVSPRLAMIALDKERRHH